MSKVAVTAIRQDFNFDYIAENDIHKLTVSFDVLNFCKTEKEFFNLLPKLLKNLSKLEIETEENDVC